MTSNDEKRRAAAQCDHCGEIGIVRIWSDGTVRPVGQSSLCDCDSSTLRVLEEETELRDDAGLEDGE